MRSHVFPRICEVKKSKIPILAIESAEKCPQTQLCKSFILPSLVLWKVSGLHKVAQSKVIVQRQIKTILSFIIFSPSPSAFLGSFSAWFLLQVDVVVVEMESWQHRQVQSCVSYPRPGPGPPDISSLALVPVSLCHDQHLYILPTFQSPFLPIIFTLIWLQRSRPTLIFPAILNHYTV